MKRFKLYTIVILRWVSAIVLIVSLNYVNDPELSILYKVLAYAALTYTIYNSVSKNDIDLNKSIQESTDKLGMIPLYKLKDKSINYYECAKLLLVNNKIDNSYSLILEAIKLRLLYIVNKSDNTVSYKISLQELIDIAESNTLNIPVSLSSMKVDDFNIYTKTVDSLNYDKVDFFIKAYEEFDGGIPNV